MIDFKVKTKDLHVLILYRHKIKIQSVVRHLAFPITAELVFRARAPLIKGYKTFFGENVLSEVPCQETSEKTASEVLGFEQMTKMKRCNNIQKTFLRFPT